MSTDADIGTPDRCAHCGQGGGLILPFGIGPHHWLHPESCWPAWFAAGRQAEATTPTKGDGA